MKEHGKEIGEDATRESVTGRRDSAVGQSQGPRLSQGSGMSGGRSRV